MNRWGAAVALSVLGILTLLAFAAAATAGWPQIFDDAFISYRYARNLALGRGLTWNPGEAPTEGYTNFLLVLLLAPVIRAGIDPLLFTRALSYVAVIGTAWMLFAALRRYFGIGRFGAAVTSSIFLLVPATQRLPLTGLETSLYTLALLAAFVSGVRALSNNTTSASALFAVVLLTAAWLRPEALLLGIVILGWTIASRRTITRGTAIAASLLLGAGGAYMAWKWTYFGALLPNPFFLKATGGGLIHPAGARMVLGFVSDYGVVCALAVTGWLVPWLGRGSVAGSRDLQVCGWVFLVLYGGFFLRTDPVMNVHGRFLYPLVPILILLGGAAAAVAWRALHETARPASWAAPVATMAVMLAVAPAVVTGVYDNTRVTLAGPSRDGGTGLMEQERRIAARLSRFPDIDRVRIAFGDAGVIPYDTGALWLDVVGLNDTFLARTRNLSQAVDYFFAWRADLIIQPGRAGRSWLRHGHGTLGNYDAWSRDSRWDDYDYAGSTLTSGSYDLHFYVRKDAPSAAALKTHLQEAVVDGHYVPAPLPLGTRTVPDRVEWVGGR